jgi:hypothetical protein
MPASADFDRDVQQLLNTDVSREQDSVENELRAAWESFFNAVVKSAVASDSVCRSLTP